LIRSCRAWRKIAMVARLFNSGSAARCSRAQIAGMKDKLPE
jgi:hypothetical protein